MRLRHFLLTIATIALTFSCVHAQNYLFRVMANNGSNQYKSTNASDWSPVKRGLAFNSGDMVRVADQAYLGLIHKSGKTIELIKEGVFEIDDIELTIDSRKKGLGSKYTEFAMNSVMEESEYEEDVLVTRGAGDVVHVFLPAASEALQAKQILTWKSAKDPINTTFILEVKGIFDDILLSEEVSENKYVLDLYHPSLAEETMFIITVSEKDKKGTTSMEHAIDRLSDSRKDEMMSELEGILNGLEPTSAIDMIMLAYFYEGNGLLVDAGTQYTKAIELAPEVTDYVELYNAFKIRHKID